MDIERLTLYALIVGVHDPRPEWTKYRLASADSAGLERMKAQHPREFTDRKLRILQQRLDSAGEECLLIEGGNGEVYGYCHVATRDVMNERINYRVRLRRASAYLYDDHVFRAHRRRGLHAFSIADRLTMLSDRGFSRAVTIISDANTASLRSYSAFGMAPRRLLVYLRRPGRTVALPIWTPGATSPTRDESA